MNRRELRVLNLAMYAFPRDRRAQDGDVIRDLAVEMVEGGDSTSRQVADLVVAGIADRARSLGSNPRLDRIGTTFVVLATLIAPIQLAIVGATLAATLFIDASTPNNSLFTGFSLDQFWLVHAGLTWGLCLIGSILAVVGFVSQRVAMARIGSAGVLLGTWLVVGTMGGWMPGAGFAGPAEVAIDWQGDLPVTNLYFIAYSATIAAVMFVGSIFASDSRNAILPTASITKALVPGVGALAVVATASAISPFMEQQVLIAGTTFLLILPVFTLKLRLDESTAPYAFNASCIAVLVFAAPAIVLASQLSASFSDVVFGPIEIMLLIGMAALVMVPFARALKQAWLERARN